MKEFTTTLTAIALALAIGSTVQAGHHKGNLHGSCDDCAQSEAMTDQQRTFQQNTIDLRQDLMLKRFEVQRENLKATPDIPKVAALKSEIKAIQTKIHEIHVQSGLPANEIRDGECVPKGRKERGCAQGQTGGCNGPCNSK